MNDVVALQNSKILEKLLSKINSKATIAKIYDFTMVVWCRHHSRVTIPVRGRTGAERNITCLTDAIMYDPLTV